MNTHQEMYYDQQATRSPATHRQQSQTLHRQPSRQFDGYGQIHNSIYTPEDHSLRYEPSRFDRMNATIQGGGGGGGGGGYGYDLTNSQPWNPSPFNGSNPYPSFAATGRIKATSRVRPAIPSTWLDQQQLPTTNAYGGMNLPSIENQQLNPESYPAEAPQHPSLNPDDLIPTAIVIKNIPFAVKKEQLLDLMTQMSLPLPYAFNYHFDNGIFRGLAFANFTSPQETATVIQHLNHFELQGRKLRVEYKKMLPPHERERIEREKRERRGQLEEQHRPMATSQLHNQASLSSLSSHMPAASPSPLSSRNEKPAVDLNDPQTLNFYSQLLLFRDDQSREALIFPATLPPGERLIVHTLAHHMELGHVSRGMGDQRQVHVFREGTGHNLSPSIPQVSTVHHGDTSRRGLNRAATIDFNEARSTEPGMYGTLRGQQSSGFLGIPDSPSGFGAQQNLRAAKSFADLRSYTPSPVSSTASFPAALQSNIPRFQDYGPGSVASTTPTLTPAVSGLALGGQHRNDSDNVLVNGLSSMSLGGGLGVNGPNGGSPRRLRGMFSWDQDHQQQSAGGPIGSNRTFSSNYDDQSRDRGQSVPLRQPRGPVIDRGSGFSRGRQNGHQGRGSDELRASSSVEIIVE